MPVSMLYCGVFFPPLERPWPPTLFMTLKKINHERVVWLLNVTRWLKNTHRKRRGKHSRRQRWQKSRWGQCGFKSSFWDYGLSTSVVVPSEGRPYPRLWPIESQRCFFNRRPHPMSALKRDERVTGEARRCQFDAMMEHTLAAGIWLGLDGRRLVWADAVRI